jgi:hypothetical protein
MTHEHTATTLRDLAHERGLRLSDLGPSPTMSVYNQGKVIPGPQSLRRIAEALGMAPQDVMAVCRAAVARRKDQVAS